MWSAATARTRAWCAVAPNSPNESARNWQLPSFFTASRDAPSCAARERRRRSS
jgi:hypothetical protein